MDGELLVILNWPMQRLALCDLLLFFVISMIFLSFFLFLRADVCSLLETKRARDELNQSKNLVSIITNSF